MRYTINDDRARRQVTITDQEGREWLALKVNNQRSAPDFGPTDRKIKLAIAAAVVRHLNDHGGQYNLDALTLLTIKPKTHV